MGRPSRKERRKTSDLTFTNSIGSEERPSLDHDQRLSDFVSPNLRSDRIIDDSFPTDLFPPEQLDTASSAPTAGTWWNDQSVNQTQLPELGPVQSFLQGYAGFDEVSLPNGNPLAAQSSDCQCLSSLTLQLSSFQSLPPTSFPYSLALPSAATKVAWSALQCQTCPDDFVSGVQNMMLLATLLTLITNEYAKILDYIDQTADKGAADKGAAVSFRMGQTDPEMMHLHTGTLDCPMGINVDIEAEDFRRMAKGAVREKVLGGPRSGEGALVTLLDKMQRRQEYWHSGRARQGSLWGRRCEKVDTGTEKEITCINMVRNIRRSIELLPLD